MLDRKATYTHKLKWRERKNIQTTKLWSLWLAFRRNAFQAMFGMSSLSSCFQERWLIENTRKCSWMQKCRIHRRENLESLKSVCLEKWRLCSSSDRHEWVMSRRDGTLFLFLWYARTTCYIVQSVNDEERRRTQKKQDEQIRFFGQNKQWKKQQRIRFEIEIAIGLCERWVREKSIDVIGFWRSWKAQDALCLYSQSAFTS